VVLGEDMPHLTLDLSDDPTAVLAALTSAYLDQVATSPLGWPSNPEEPR
jgi:hypothetical protein